MAPSRIDDDNIASSAVPAYYSNTLRQKYRLHELDSTLAQNQHDPPTKWHPDYKTFEARSIARLKAGGLETSLPTSFPQVLRGDSVWHAGQFVDPGQYIHHLEDDEIKEVQEALRTFKCTL